MTAKDFVSSDKFNELVRSRWTFSFFMLAILFVMYYGYIFLVALNREFLAKMVGTNITMGTVLFVLVIIGAWLLTVVYVLWANASYDKKVEALKKDLQ
ncbi:MAG: DUF485 domain-containing protein [Deferribacterales bacterium]